MHGGLVIPNITGDDDNDVHLLSPQLIWKPTLKASFVFDWSWATPTSATAGLCPKRIWHPSPVTSRIFPPRIQRHDVSFSFVPWLAELIQQANQDEVSSWHLLFNQAKNPPYRGNKRPSASYFPVIHWFNRWLIRKHWTLLSNFLHRNASRRVKRRRQSTKQGIPILLER